MPASPLDVARIHTASATRRDVEAYRARKAGVRRLGYNGPLTRAELAASTTL